MTRTSIFGFSVGALMGAYGNLFGLQALGIVLAAGVFGMLLAIAAHLALRVDRTRLMELFGELES
jgi:hypothetical protein